MTGSHDRTLLTLTRSCVQSHTFTFPVYCHFKDLPVAMHTSPPYMTGMNSMSRKSVSCIEGNIATISTLLAIADLQILEAFH